MKRIRMGLVILALLVMAAPAIGQRGRGFGRGAGSGGHAADDDRHDADHEVFQFLLTHHKKITRSVKELPNGVETLTESNDPEIAAKIKEHVEWMKVRIDQAKPIRLRDPLFAELFRHTEKIVMNHEDTERGVRVIETSDDPYVAKLIKAHARAVSGFVERGFAEARKNHPVPGRETVDAAPRRIAPAIKDYGKVVSLPTAAAQPRDGSRICVDITAGGSREALNPAIEKVARYVNIYRGAGAEPADARISMVLHGRATLDALNDDAWASRFGGDGNPNLDCLQQLHHAGVEILVCGQSLLGQDGKPEDLVVFADVAVSALTALVNHQADGYAIVQIGPK